MIKLVLYLYCVMDTAENITVNVWHSLHGMDVEQLVTMDGTGGH